MQIHTDKRQQRGYLRRQRQQLKDNIRQHATTRINRLLYPLIRRKKRIAVYWAVGSELSLWSFMITAQKSGATVYLPYIAARQRQLWFTPCHILSRKQATARFMAKYGLKQTRGLIRQFHGQRIRARYLHTLIVPLLGIDQRGNRLGQGGGYYDATLSALHSWQPKLIGAGFACLRLQEIQTERHDIKIPYFVCEQGIMHFKSDRNNLSV